MLLIHSDGDGTKRVDELGRAARTDRALHGVPARVLPVGVWHTASVGIDLWLSAFAQGANQVLGAAQRRRGARNTAAHWPSRWRSRRRC